MANDLRVQAELITAVFDLKLVQGIRNAIRVNLLKKGGREGPLGNIENPKPPPSLPNFGEQRHPGATERPSTIGVDATPPRLRGIDTACPCDHRAADRATDVAPLPSLIPSDVTLPATDAERASGWPAKHESPLVPPWRMPLPVEPQILLVKYDACRPDQKGKGQMLDLFI